MIELKNLQLKNFLSHVDTNLDLEKYKGLVLIEGSTKDGHYSSNGSGKSTLLEGIVYALTGNTLRGVSVNDVVNRNHKKNTRVSLQFSREDREYTIDRYRKDDEFKDSLIFKQDDTDISKRVNKETQKCIEDTLGISYKIISSTMLLGEGLSSRFTQLSDPEKKSLIESTLNLNYDMSAIRAKANNELSKLKLEKSNIEGRLSAYSTDFNLEEAEDAIKDLEAELHQDDIKLMYLRDSLDELKKLQEPLSQKMNLIYSTILQHDNLSDTLSKLDDEGVKYHQELLSMEKSECPYCTVCNQSLESEESKEAFRNSYAEKIKDVTDRMKTVVDSINSLPDRNILVTKYDSLKEESSNIMKDIDRINNDIRVVNDHYYLRRSQADSLRGDIDRFLETAKNIDILTVMLKELDKDIAKYEYFYKLFSPTGIIVNILSEAIEYINSRISVYSDILLERDYHISFEKGKISLVDSKGASYSSLSNGEKRRLDIAIQFSLHDYVQIYCGMKMDTIFIDEILDTLDDIGVENIIDVLRLKLEYCQLNSIYVITHNNTLKSKFDSVITVEKSLNGDSYLQ